MYGNDQIYANALSSRIQESYYSSRVKMISICLKLYLMISAEILCFVMINARSTMCTKSKTDTFISYWLHSDELFCTFKKKITTHSY